ncbi:MAG: hypothetical protein PVG85_05745 [Deltaproteobacteria bacterium]
MINPDFGNTMVDKPGIGLDVGLSDEEKEDLDKLIKGLKEDQPNAQVGATPEDIQKQIASMMENLTQLGEMLMKFDTKMKSLYEIVRLSYEKGEMMNKRIDAIVESMKGGRNVSPESES